MSSGRAIGALLGAAVAALAPARPAHAERRYAVLIGNDHGREDDPVLRYAERDAAEMARVLRRLGDVPPENLVMILGEGVEPIRQALLEVNARIRTEEQLSDEPSTLLVYYSGHADAEGLHPGPRPMTYKELRALVAGSAARARLLIIDGCRSGGLTEVKGGHPSSEFGLNEGGEGVEGLAMMSSSAVGEDSHESERLEASFFTHHLVNALLGMGDENRDGAVTVSEAYAYAYQQTLRSSGRTESLQHPTYAYALKGRGDLVMTRLRARDARSARIRLGQSGTYLVFRGAETGPVTAELHAESGEESIALDPGTYFVEWRGRDHYREYQVALAEGQSLDLQTQPFRAERYARFVRKGSEQRGLAHGVFVLASARGELVAGQGPMPSVLAGYDLDLAWVSLAAFARYGASRSTADGDFVRSHQELGIGLMAQRFLDLPWLSLGLGLLGEGVYHRQSFSTSGRAPPRSATNLGFGLVGTLERELVGPLVLRIQGGPLTQVFRQAEVKAGIEEKRETVTRISGWAALGLGWKL